MAKKVKEKAKAVKKELLSFKFVKETLAVYLFLMMVIYPLYYEDKYYNMGEAKWNFFRNVSYYITGPGGFPIPTFLVLLLIFFIWYQVDLSKQKKLKEFWSWKKASVIDRFVFVYLIVCLVSYILSPYKDYTLWGYEGWYMGLIAQAAFVALYLFMSRFWRWDDIMMIIYLGASALVFLFGVLHRFLIDPLEMYVDLDPVYIRQFLSTLGQTTWYDSYVVIVFPIGLFAYCYAEKKYVRILAALYTVLGSMTIITTDSDSAFFAVAGFMAVLLYFAFQENKLLIRFLEVLLIMLLSWRVVGFLQLAFPEQAVPLGTLMLFGSQHWLMWIPIAALAVLYFLAVRAEKEKKLDVQKLLWVRRTAFILLFLVLAGGILYIVLNTKGLLPEKYRTTQWYLLFNEYWGNNRGHSWMVTMATLRDCMTQDPLRFLFGAGPDGFYNLVYEYHSAELIAKWGENTVLTCAHNEWLTQIVNVGLVGGLAYLGIFISAIVRFGRESKKCPALIAPIMCIVAYMAHNFFCYQQIICTPIIFIIIGAGESIARVGELRPIYEEN